MMLKYIWRGSWRDWKDGYSLGDVSLSAFISTPASDSWRWPSLGLSFNWGSIMNIWLGLNLCLAITSSSVGFTSGKYEANDLPVRLAINNGTMFIPVGAKGPSRT